MGDMLYKHVRLVCMGDPLTKTQLMEAIQPLDQKLESTKVLLQGPIGKPHEGIIVRMDRIERAIEWLVKGFGLVLAAFVTAGIYRLIEWMTTTTPPPTLP